MPDNPFYLLAPFIREFIYNRGWTKLRGIQVAACHVIFETEDNLLLSAGTASGKTEAAFFPILSQFDADPPASVGALYIGPLKALINDQFERLNDLCREADIPVWHWHGDVAQSHKEKLIKNPSGILQITPESLEALLMHRHSDIVRLFGDLRYVVIDEVHALMRGDRGAQVLCLLERLSRMAGVNPRRIGLSATIGDLDLAGKWLGSGTGRATATPKIEVAGTRWRLSMAHFYTSGDKEGAKEAEEPPERENGAQIEVLTAEPEEVKKEDLAPESADAGLAYIFEHTRGKKCLVFPNSREECEAVTSTLRQYCELKNEPDRFYIHHGNLSASYREDAESAMKDETNRFTTVTTATLELGIDIGLLERAFQLGAPFTVSSFLQRMGRTGRRGAPPEMWFVIREEEQLPTAPLPQLIPWELLRAIALVQLYLEDRWVEPPKTGRLPYSLLYHQTMCTLAGAGELRPAELAARVLTLTPFKNISQEDYKCLLNHMLVTGHLQRTDERGLIIGLKGERQVNSYKFFAVFKENEDYTVRWKSQELGTIVLPPPVGERIALAGRVWVITELDYKKKLIFVEPVKGQVPAFFGLCPGDINTRVLERMKTALYESRTYPYLLQNAKDRLAEARLLVSNADALGNPLIYLGGETWCLFPWLGTYAFLALERFLKLKCAPELSLTAVESVRPYYITFKMRRSPDEFLEAIRDIASRPLDPMELLYPGEVPVFEKYDEFVPDELVRKGFAYGVLDTEGMLERVRELGRED